jgi:ADP-heptose:LPS heptosyltransferase
MQNRLCLEEGSLQRVALFRALQLGDMLCAVPALRALRVALPRAKITLIGLPWAKSFVERFSCYVDGFVAFPGYPGLPEQPAYIEQFPSFLAAIQNTRFDLIIQMHGSGVLTNPLTLLFGARHTTGFFLPGEYCPDERYFLAYPANDSEIRRLLGLVGFLGVPPQGEELEFPLTTADYQALAAIDKASALRSGAYVCVHPGARYLSRRWWPERFALVADALAAQGLHIVLTGSTEERTLTQTVAQAMRAPALDLAGQTSLGALSALLSHARLLICNDTGVSHLAAALHVPSVVIASGSDPDRWAPLDQYRHRVVYSPIDCRPCQHFSCPIGHPCAAGVTPEIVLTQAQALLSEQHLEFSSQPTAVGAAAIRQTFSHRRNFS